MQFEIKRDGAPTLFGRCWKAADPKAVVMIVHGLGEHIGRYDGYAKALNKAGYHVIGVDFRGHGRSEGDKGWVSGLPDMMADIDAALEKTRATFPKLPFFFLGHSMGGGLGLRYLADNPKSGVKAMVASAPMIAPTDKVPALQAMIVKLITKLSPKFTLSPGLDGAKISTIEAEAHRYVNDPLTHDKLSGKLAIAMIENGQWLAENPARISLPVLFVHSPDDELTDFPASQALASKMKMAEFVSLPGNAHEMHHDVDAKTVFKTVTAFLDRQLKA